MPIHKELAAGRWFTLTLAEQLGNIGSDVERAIRAAKTGNQERKERALDRALELLDLTLADPRRAGEQEQAELGGPVAVEPKMQFSRARGSGSSLDC